MLTVKIALPAKPKCIIGKLVQKTNEIEQKPNNKQQPLQYFSESVQFEANKVNEVRDCFEGMSSIQRINASDFCPCEL